MAVHSPIVLSNNAPEQFNIAIDVNCYAEILSFISDSDFLCDVWLVKVHEHHVKQTLCFSCLNDLREEYKVLCKCYAANMLGLSFTFSSIKQNLSKVSIFLHYISDKKIALTSIRNSLIENFFKRYEDTPSVYNSFSAAIQNFLTFCMQNTISFSETISCPFIEADKSRRVRRAPDKCIIDVLDKLFFNDTSLPTDMRCAYLLMRLILNRISEVLNILIDCISYPEDGIYTISIPTQKETPMHIPHYKKYNRSLTDFYTARLYEAIQAQRDYALSQQDSLPPEFQGYLFVSSSNNSSLLTGDEFNTFINRLCTEHDIRDSAGNLAHISSHALRHYGITERIQSKIISPEQTMVEANHSSLSTTLSYGYSSLNDEAERNSKILTAVFPDLPVNGYKQNQAISKNKYEILKRSPFVRSIPGMGLCANMRCKPRFEDCIKCNYFSPNKIYREYFTECIAMYAERLDTLRKNPTHSKAAIAFNEERLQLYKQYLERCDEFYGSEQKI